MDRSPIRPSGWLIAAAGLMAAGIAIWLARVSIPAFVLMVIILLGLMGYVALRWPRVALVLVALSAILDRYVVPGLLPPQLGFATHVSSSALLGSIGLVLTLRAWRADRLLAALRHPATPFLMLFIALALISALVNHVGAAQAIAGLGFTLKGVVLFYTTRMVGFSVRQALAAITALVGLLTVAGLIAILQALVGPDVLGLTALFGRFGEAYRLASFFGDPNVFGALISASAPFALIAAARAESRRDRFMAGGLAFILILPLWLSFSRGGWLGMLVGFTLATLFLDRRALLIGIAMLGITFGAAVTMPRDLAVAKPDRANLVGSTVNRITTVASGKDLRIQFVKNAIPILRTHPLIGVGPGRYGGAAADIFGTPIYSQYGTTRLLHGAAGQRTVDNFWLHLFVEAGILGGLALVGAILVVLVPIYRRAAGSRHWQRVVLVGIAAAATSLIVNSVTTMLLEASSVAFVFWFLLGLGSPCVERDWEG